MFVSVKLSIKPLRQSFLEFLSVFPLCRIEKSYMQMFLLRAKKCFIIKEHGPWKSKLSLDKLQSQPVHWVSALENG